MKLFTRKYLLKAAALFAGGWSFGWLPRSVRGGQAAEEYLGPKIAVPGHSVRRDGR